MRSTAQVLVGHPDYEVTGGTAIYKGKKLFEFEAEERSHMGLFLRWVSIFLCLLLMLCGYLMDGIVCAVSKVQ